MKKIELLAPAGDMETLKAAISAGADAIYLSGKKYGARAFAHNFSNEELEKAVNICHFYDCLVYVTVNTIIYEREMDDFITYVDFLYKIGVDALIIQDLGAIDLVHKLYPDLTLHASTQANIHSLESVKVLDKIGVKRCVLARELSLEEVKDIKNNTSMELEVFVQGALCVCYSGLCLMSSMIGGRSGNRGTCAQCCRMKYSLMKDNKISLKDKYLLSMKDLCLLDNLENIIPYVDCLKIEGRMKRKEYVYQAVLIYRKKIDAILNHEDINLDKDKYILRKLFNRDYTLGFMFNSSSVTNINSPNHQGVMIGKILHLNKNSFDVLLSDDLSINDGVRCPNDDYGFIVTEMFKGKTRVKSASKNDIITIKKKINKLGPLIKTSDYNDIKEIDALINEGKKLSIDMYIVAKKDENIELTVQYKDVIVTVKSEFIIPKAIKTNTTYEDIRLKLQRVNEDGYKLDNLDCDIDCDIFIPVSVLNNLRRDAISKLNKKRLIKREYKNGCYSIEIRDYKQVQKKSILIDSNQDSLDYDEVYNYQNTLNATLKLPRIISKHKKINKRVLVSDLGSLNVYDNVVTDFSFNVVNSYTVALLNFLGADKVTLSYELSKEQIKDIIDNYHSRYHKHPNLEVIVSSYPEVMVCKYKLDGDYLIDRFKNKFKIVRRGDNMHIYHYQKVIINDDLYKIGVNYLRYHKELS